MGALTEQRHEQGGDFSGLRGFEVGATITGGIRIFCINCTEWFAEWSSLQKYPRVAEIVTACEQHVCYMGEFPAVGQ